jgi:hypothetical protein
MRRGSPASHAAKFLIAQTMHCFLVEGQLLLAIHSTLQLHNFRDEKA